MSSPLTQRGWLLLEQHRPDLAMDFARQALAQDVNDAEAHRLLAMAMVQGQRGQRDKRLDDALRSAEMAVQLAPDEPSSLYVLAYVQTDMDDWHGAGRTITEALERQPDNPAYWNLSAVIHMHFARWAKALEDIGRGLALDPEDGTLQANRATCLVNLGRAKEVTETVDAAMAHNPEDPDLHVTQGLAYMHRGDMKRAMQHFGEALRLDPTNPGARYGMLEAMRARNLLYAALLRFFFWMARFSNQQRFMIMVGGIFAVNIITNILDKSNPALSLAVSITWIAFVLLTWVAQPLVNLMLRLDKFARYMLEDHEIIASNIVGGLVIVALSCLAGGLLTPFEGLLWVAAGAVFLMLPVAAMLSERKRATRFFYGAYWGLLVTLTVIALACAFSPVDWISKLCIYLVIIGTAAFSWVSSAMSSFR